MTQFQNGIPEDNTEAKPQNAASLQNTAIPKYPIPAGATDLGNENIRTADGSLWVWFPAYWYKINADGTGGQIALVETEGLTLHPAFIVNGSAINGFYVAKYPASRSDATAWSPGFSMTAKVTPGTVVFHSVAFVQAQAACANMNKTTGLADKIRLMRNMEWGALAIWCLINKGPGFPHGNNANTNPPADVNYPEEKAINDPTRENRALVGTGPVNWAHDGTVNGIYDLNGLVWEWVDGLRINKNAVLQVMDSTGTYQDADAGYTTTYNKYFATLDEVGNMKGAAYPASTSTTGVAAFGSDYGLTTECENSNFCRGGLWGSTASAGVFALNFYEPQIAVTVLGFRPVLFL